MERRVLLGSRGGLWRIRVARTRRERRRGLRGESPIGTGEGMLFPRARSVHTFGMRFPITVAWLDADLRVVEVRRVPPGRLLLPRWRARHVLESSGDADLRRGDSLTSRGGTGPELYSPRRPRDPGTSGLGRRAPIV